MGYKIRLTISGHAIDADGPEEAVRVTLQSLYKYIRDERLEALNRRKHELRGELHGLNRAIAKLEQWNPEEGDKNELASILKSKEGAP